METTIAKATGPMVLTGGTIAMGGSADVWLVPLLVGGVVAVLTVFIFARTLLTKNAKRGRHS